MTSVIPSCLGDLFCHSSGGCFRSACAGLSQPSSFSLATAGPDYGPSALLRKCSKTASCGMHATPVSFRRRQNPLAADLHRQALTPIGILALPQGPSGHSGLASLSERFRVHPVCRLSASRLLSGGVSHTTLLSIAIAVVIRRHPRSACYPCLSRSETEPPGRLPPAPGSHRDEVGWACLSPAIAGSRQATFASRLPKSDGPLCLF